MIQTTFFVQHRVTWKSKIRRMSCKKSLKRRQPLNSWQASWMNRHQRRHQWPICCGVVRLLFQIPLLQAFILWFVLIHHRQISNFSNVKALRNNHMFPWSFVTRIDMRSNPIKSSYRLHSSVLLFQFSHLLTSSNFEIHTLACIIFWSCGRKAFSRASDGHTVSTRRTKSYSAMTEFWSFPGGIFWKKWGLFFQILWVIQFDWKFNEFQVVRFFKCFLEAFVLGGLVHDARCFNTFQRFFHRFQDIHIHINFNSTDHHNQT